jgi:hypothetical protein
MSRQSLGHVSVAEHDGALVLERRWFSPNHVIVLVAAAVWLTFVGMVGRAAVAARHEWVTLAVAVFVVVGAGLMYWGLAGLLNRTSVSIAPDRVRVGHGPLPWRGRCSFATRDIERTSIERVVRASGAMGERETHQVRAHLRTGEVVVLLAGLTPKALAEEAQRRIDDRLRGAGARA